MPVIKPSGQDVLTSRAELLVCPTNAVGAMGAGLAKTFRDAIAGLYPSYKRWCSMHDPNRRVPFVFGARRVGKIVYCLHTKRHWRENSSLMIVQRGLDLLRDYCNENNIASVAIPALGCGKGQLAWKDVRPLLLTFAEEVTADVEIYHPDGVNNMI